MITKLDDEDPVVRTEAVLALRDMGPDAADAVPTLAAKVADEDYLVALGATWALMAIGNQSIPALLDVLHNSEPDVREFAAYTLGHFHPESEQVISNLLDALYDKDARWGAESSLGLYGKTDKKVVAALLRRLDCRNPHVRLSVIDALGDIGPNAADAVPALIKIIKPVPDVTPGETLNDIMKNMKAAEEVDSRIRGAAIIALGQIGTAAREAIPAITDSLWLDMWNSAYHQVGWVFTNINPDVEQTMQFLISKIIDTGDKGFSEDVFKAFGSAAVPYLIDALKNDNNKVQYVASMALGEIHPRPVEAIPALIEATKAGVSAAAGSLGRMGPDYAEITVPVLIEALSSRDLYVRANAISGLGDIGPKAAPAVSGLIKALDDWDPSVQEVAYDALGQIGPPFPDEVIPTLIERLYHPDWAQRDCAIEALGAIGPDARDATDRIIELLKDKEEYVRRDAARYLVKINDDPDIVLAPLMEVCGNMDLGSSYSFMAIGQMGAKAKAAVPFLMDLLGNENDEIRSAAISALGGIGPDAEEAVPALLEILRNKEGEKSYQAAVYALGKIGDTSDDVISALAQILRNGDEFLMDPAIEALGALGPGAKDAVPELVKALGSKQWSIRARAAKSIGLIKHNAPGAIPRLKLLLTGEYKTIADAEFALYMLGDEPGKRLKALIYCLDLDKLEDLGARGEAMRLLAIIGPPAKDALPRLREIAAEADFPLIRDMYLQQIAKIEAQ